MMTGSSHSSLERWAILGEIRKNVIHNKKRIFQVKIIFKQKLLVYLEIAEHVCDLNRSKKKKISASKYFLNGEKRGSQYWAYDI